MRNRNLLACYLGLAAVLGSSLALPAEERELPSLENPAPLLNARGEEAQAIVLLAEKSLAEVYKLLDPIEPRRLQDKLVPADARVVGPAAVLLTELEWHAKRLIRRQEAAGYDLELRRGELSARLGDAVIKFRALPKFSQTTMEAQIHVAIAAGVKQVPRLSQLVQGGKLIEAEGGLYKIQAEINRSGIWLAGVDLTDSMRPIIELSAAIAGPVEMLEQQQAVAEARARLMELRPNWTAFLSEAKAAAEAVASSGQAEWRGGRIPGPAAVREVLSAWEALHRSCHQARAQAWTLIAFAAADGETLLSALESEHQAARDQLPGLLAAIIQADTRRAPAAEALALYPQYLGEAAPAAALGDRKLWLQALDPALNQLAAKAGIGDKVAQARKASEPLLHWRRRIARAQAARRHTMENDLHRVCEAAVRLQPDVGLLPAEQLSIGALATLSPVDAVLKDAQPRLLGKAAAARDLVPGGKGGVSRYSQRIYGVWASGDAPAISTQAERLEAELYATAGEALTLDAAATLWAARRGVYESAGGVIEGAAVDSVLSRFATLGQGEQPLLPLLELTGSELSQSPIYQGVLLRVRLKPQWVQHECFVADLP